MKRAEGGRPSVAPVGALGDIGAALFATIGILAALRHRDMTGKGQYVDIAMFDAMVAMTDIVTNFWSMGLRNGNLGPLIIDPFQASDGWFIIQVGREAHFEQLVETIGRPDLLTDPRFATREGWVEHLEDVLRPAIETWAAQHTRTEACAALGIPVIGGNVSFYNASGDADIDPTPVMGVVGLIDDLRERPAGAVLRPGDEILVLGTRRADLGGSEWAVRNGCTGGRPPTADLAAAVAVHDLVAGLVRDGALTGVHDVKIGRAHV